MPTARHNLIAVIALALFTVSLPSITHAAPPDKDKALAWPAEAFASTQNITASGMDSDLSGACWNAAISSLYVVRQDRRVWRLVESGGTYVVADAWTNLPTGSDMEAITQVDEHDAYVVYLLHEDDGTVYEVDLAAPTPTLLHQWRLTLGGHMPAESSGDGPEAITFVPDAWLAASGFVAPNGNPYTSVNGMGGLIFVGHQNGGRLYVFDLDPDTSNSFTFVGDYPTGRPEIAGLEFDRNNGLLYVWHNSGGTTWNELEVLSLAPIGEAGSIAFAQIATYTAPPGAQSLNMEGIALSRGASSCADGLRDFFVTIDGGDSQALVRFREFPCDCNGNGTSDAEEFGNIEDFVSALLDDDAAMINVCIFDCNADGTLNGDDVSCYASRLTSN